MCVSIMQMRVENRYMAAIQIIEEEQLSAMGGTPAITQNEQLDGIDLFHPKNSHTAQKPQQI